MAKSEYRNIDILDAESIREDESINAGNRFIDFDDFNQRIDEIEDEVGEIIDLIKDEYNVKEALEKLEELKRKLY